MFQIRAMALAFSLQSDMNQIFQMRYYEVLQTKELKSYKSSNFAKIKDGPRASSSIAIVPESDLKFFDRKL